MKVLGLVLIAVALLSFAGGAVVTPQPATAAPSHPAVAGASRDSANTPPLDAYGNEIANAVAEEYLVLQRVNYEDASTALQALLTKARDEVSEQLKTAEDRYSEFRKTSHLNPDGRSPHRSRQDAVDSQVSSLEIQKTQLRSELRSLEEAMRTGGSREAILMLVGKQTSGSAVDGASTKAINETVNSARTVTEAIFPLMVQEAAMTAELGADHPKLRALKMQIEMTREFFREMAEGSTGNGKTETADVSGSYLDRIASDVKLARPMTIAVDCGNGSPAR